MYGILDYGTGNISSVKNMLRHCGLDSTVISNRSDIDKVKAIIIPGVGHFEFAISSIRNLDFFDALILAITKDKIPTIGICLGMHLFANSSEEGTSPGLGLVNGVIKKFSLEEIYLPHLGWNTIKSDDFDLFPHEESRFYFVHNFYFECQDESIILSRTSLRGKSFISAFRFENIIGVQFHPEKSHKYGVSFFKGFHEKYLNG